MQAALRLIDLRDVAGEPRVWDLRLARRLDFSRPSNIRNLIASHSAELDTYGGLLRCEVNPGRQGGRPGSGYSLNEAQCLLLCMKSDAPLAAEVRAELIAVFQAWRHGGGVVNSPATDEIMGLFDARLSAHLEPFRLQISEVSGNVTHLRAAYERLSQGILNLPGGSTAIKTSDASFSGFVKDQSAKAIHVYNGGRCLDCKAQITDVNGTRNSSFNADHALGGRSDHTIYNLNPICDKCNQGPLKKATYRRKREYIFQAYHTWLVEVYLPDHPEALADGKAHCHRSTYTHDMRQGSIEL